MPDPSHDETKPMSTAESDRLFAERVATAEAAKRQERIKLSPEASARVRAQRAGDAVDRPRMLPGMAAIALFVLAYSLINAIAAWQGRFGTGNTRYAALAISSFFIVGVFGFLRLKRWGWALVLGGTLFLAIYDVAQFIRAHVSVTQGGAAIVQALFATVFFLYLVRDEVRERVH